MRSGRVLTALATGAIGLGLITTGLPRVLSAFASLPGDGPLARVLDRKPVSSEQLATVVQSRDRALVWSDDARLHTERALGRLMLAERKPVIDAGTDLAPVREDLAQGLARAPSNPYAWARLAYVEDLQRGPTDAAMAYLRMSVLTGPYEDRLLLVRLDVVLRGWERVLPEDAGLFLRQARLAWKRSPKEVANLVRSTKRADVILLALADDPEALAGFREQAGVGE